VNVLPAQRKNMQQNRRRATAFFLAATFAAGGGILYVTCMRGRAPTQVEEASIIAVLESESPARWGKLEYIGGFEIRVWSNQATADYTISQTCAQIRSPPVRARLIRSDDGSWEMASASAQLPLLARIFGK